MTVERLRRDIDAGRTGDKSPGSDPAAAPLGTDDEAAGTPVAPAVAESERNRAKAVGAGLDSLQNQPASDGLYDRPRESVRVDLAAPPVPPRPRRSRLVIAGLTMALAIGLVIVATVAVFAR